MDEINNAWVIISPPPVRLTRRRYRIVKQSTVKQIGLPCNSTRYDTLAHDLGITLLRYFISVLLLHLLLPQLGNCSTRPDHNTFPVVVIHWSPVCTLTFTLQLASFSGVRLIGAVIDHASP